MADAGPILGKESTKGILFGLVCIAIFVAVGSVVAQSMSHGPEHGGSHAEAETAQQNPADSSGSEKGAAASDKE